MATLPREASARTALTQSAQDLVGMALTYGKKTQSEVNPRSLLTPCTQMDLVSRKQPAHYNRSAGQLHLPWDALPAERGGNRVPTKLHDKPFNAYGSPVRGPKVQRGMLEREPEDIERRQDYLFRGERRSYLFDDKGSRTEKHEKYVADDQIFNLRPHSEKFCSSTLLQDRFPSENLQEALWAPNWVPDNIATRKKAHREKGAGRKAGEPDGGFHDPSYVSPTKYGLYDGIFDQPGTKAAYHRTSVLMGELTLNSDTSETSRKALSHRMSGRGAPALSGAFAASAQSFEDRLARPRWGYAGKATVHSNDSVRRMAAHARSYDLLRPRNNWSCPELGYHWTHRS